MAKSLLHHLDSRPLVRIVAPHFVAGLEADERGRVVRTAPILRWMMGMTGAMVAGHCAGRGWTWERIA